MFSATAVLTIKKRSSANFIKASVGAPLLDATKRLMGACLDSANFSRISAGVDGFLARSVLNIPSSYSFLNSSVSVSGSFASTVFLYLATTGYFSPALVANSIL